MRVSIQTVDHHNLPQAIHELTAQDPALDRIVARLGVPPLWSRPPGFPTLVHIILEQQVSLASAKAAFDRLLAHTEPLTPETLLALRDETMLAIGFSRQKRDYARLLAHAISGGSLNLDALGAWPDADARAALLAQKGIGPWTADIYLLMALGRADIWPAGDLALAVAVQEVKGLTGRPTPQELAALAEAWRPWRAVAARILWLHYLGRAK